MIAAICNPLFKIEPPSFLFLATRTLDPSSFSLTPCGLVQGFVTRDRRKPHVREADELAAQLEAGALSESEAEDEAGAAAAPGGGANGVVLDGLVSEPQQFQMLVRTVRVLVRTGRASEAQQLTEHVNSLLSQRGAHKCAPAAHPPCCIVQAIGAKEKCGEFLPSLYRAACVAMVNFTGSCSMMSWFCSKDPG